MNATAAVAIAGLATTLLVAIAGFWFQERRDRRASQREHQAWLRDRRADVYVTTLETPAKERLGVAHGMDSDEALRHLAALSAFGSPEVVRAYEQWLNDDVSDARRKLEETIADELRHPPAP